MSEGPGGPEAVLAAFVDQYRRDQETGVVRSIGQYLNLFPQHHDAIVREYVARKSAAVPPPVNDGDTVGPYRLQEEIGSGGQGRVYRAVHIRTGQRVAVKVLRHLGPITEKLLAYFKREAQIAARLDHAGLCSIYDADIDAGVPYIAMRFIEGKTLEQLLLNPRRPDGGRVGALASTTGDDPFASPPHENDRAGSDRGRTTSLSGLARQLWFFESTARAIHAAHEAGVIHRDIKPSNIMVTTAGEPVVLDFGLSRDEYPTTHSLTLSGDLLGTPAYMSPEQLTRQNIAVDRRTDIWSLGVVLYECVIAQPPFCSATREDFYYQILTKEPVRPRRINPSIPRDLEIVMMTALEKDRARRYQTALDFAEDLRRVREHKTVTAIPAGMWIRLSRWVQRNRGLALALGLLVLAVATGLVVSLVLLSDARQAWSAEREQHSATKQLQSEYRNLADDRVLSALEQEYDALWPPTEALAARMGTWLELARSIVANRHSYDEALRRMAAVEVGAGFAPTPEHGWRKELLARLALAAGNLPDRIEEMERRLGFARTIERATIDDYLGVWREIADAVSADRRFRGAPRLTPQLGLVPLGVDRASGLQEFAVLQSGSVPRRDHEGQLQISEDSAIVLVLLGGGTFVMGSPDDEAEREPREALAQVVLHPFLIGKHEVSQAQWVRMMGTNPSSGRPGNQIKGVTTTLLHPVEGVSWTSCQKFVERLGLVLPSEAQWEFACRAGERTAYAFGNDAGCLREHRVNLADASLRAIWPKDDFPGSVSWSDGYPMHAPITACERNSFGIIGMLGNVTEWCRDAWISQRKPVPTPGDGVDPGSSDSRRVYRGGSWQFGANCCRSAWRDPHPPSSVVAARGLRVARPLL